jgi:alkylation response protein AidB-like acyl-CoA dehydrogenase
MLQGTSSFLVPRGTPGLTIARCNETVGCRFMNNGELVFEDMRVPADHLLVEADALGQAAVYFRPGKIIQAAKNLGVGVRAFEMAAEYVQNYVQGGRILIKHQAVALRLADMATRIEAVRALLERAARAVDDNARTPTRYATWPRCSRPRKSSRSRSTRWSCTAATASCWISASRRSSAMPRSSCTWMPPSTFRA